MTICMDEPLKLKTRPQTQTRKVDAADKRNIALTNKKKSKEIPAKEIPSSPSSKEIASSTTLQKTFLQKKSKKGTFEINSWK